MEWEQVKSSDIEGGNKSIHHKSHHDEKHDRQNDSQVAKHGKNDGAIETKRHEAPAYQYWVRERSVGEFYLLSKQGRSRGTNLNNGIWTVALPKLLKEAREQEDCNRVSKDLTW